MRRSVLALLALVALTGSACGGDSLGPGEARRYFGNIDTLLGQVVEAHERGNAGEAAELAAEAYLENYEHLESEVMEEDPELNEELEGLLGTRLRRRIRQGIPQEELEEMVEEARALLDRARAAVGLA